MNPTAWIGLTVMVVSQTATLLRVEPFWSWNTPIAWTGFILFADGIVWNMRGNSWLRSNPKEFALLALASIPLWLVFEGYNRFIDNWYYIGLPENWWLRHFGYAWSFATIWPAIFEGAELVGVWRGKSTSPMGRSNDLRYRDAASGHNLSPALKLSIALGLLMLACPFFVSRPVARYLAAPVWLGFIFLLDPINARWGGESLIVDLSRQRYDRVINLILSGSLCGVLWELWNFWSRAKWHYTVPILAEFKLFEMPAPGYLGFPAFALECLTMYVFVRRSVAKLGRTIAL